MLELAVFKMYLEGNKSITGLHDEINICWKAALNN